MRSSATVHSPFMKTMKHEDGALLPVIARAMISKQLGIRASIPKTTDYPWLNEPTATFVTLKIDGELRGCIGSLTAHHSLINDLQDNAISAAFRDPRFPPLTEEELEKTDIEVSILEDSKPIQFRDEEDALGQLKVGEDGIIFECGRHHSTFLPQVWEQLPTPRMFMAHLKQKAGLTADFWSDEVRLYRYHVEKFSEDEER